MHLSFKEKIAVVTGASKGLTGETLFATGGMR
jgi:hypothetical protein